MASAASTSARYSPNVRLTVGPVRRARMIAVSAMPTPRTSVNMCAASEIRASEPVVKPTTNSSTMKPAPTHRAMVRLRTYRPDALAGATELPVSVAVSHSASVPGSLVGANI